MAVMPIHQVPPVSVSVRPLRKHSLSSSLAESMPATSAKVTRRRPRPGLRTCCLPTLSLQDAKDPSIIHKEGRRVRHRAPTGADVVHEEEGQ